MELENQTAILKLAKSTYMRLVFELNIAFSRRVFPAANPDNESDMHRKFVRDWREAKLMELNALDLGDSELAVLAANHSRKVWHRRILVRYDSVF